MEEKIMKKRYYIATYILAFIAVIGFVYSIKTSNDTAEIAKSIQESSNDVSKTLYGMKEAFKQIEKHFILSMRPIIKIQRIYFLRASEEEVSCKNPPVGLKFEYKNFSNVTCQVHDIEFHIFYGLFELKEIHEEQGIKRSILAPNEEYWYKRIDTVDFKKYLSQPKDINASPFLNCIITIYYSAIGSEKPEFMYNTKYEIRYDCSKNSPFNI